VVNSANRGESQTPGDRAGIKKQPPVLPMAVFHAYCFRTRCAIRRAPSRI
jgi:hypothetical protein